MRFPSSVGGALLAIMLLLLFLPLSQPARAEPTLIIIASGLNQPAGIDVDSHGNIFFTEDAGRSVNKILAGTTAVVNVESGLIDGLHGAAFDRNDNFFFSSHSNGNIYEMPAGTNSSIEFQGMLDPEGIDVDGVGNIYVALPYKEYCGQCTHNNSIVKIRPDGNATIYLDLEGRPWVESVAVDSHGVIYFELGDGIYRATPDASFAELYVRGFGLGRLYIDANDALFFLDMSGANETTGSVLMRAPAGSPSAQRILQLPADGPARMAAYQGILYITFYGGGYIAKVDLPPFFIGHIDDVYLDARAAAPVTIDLSGHFLPGGAGPPSYSLVSKSSSDGWNHTVVEVRGYSLSISSLDAGWTGLFCFAIRASGPSGPTVDSNEFCVHVVTPITNPTTPPGPPAAIETLGGPVVVTVVLAAAVVGIATVSTEVGLYLVLGTLLGLVAGSGRGDSVLDHFVRGRLYQSIVENPGVHFSELRRKAGIGNGAALYHLRVLEKAGFVRAFMDGTKTRFCSTERPVDPESYALSELDRSIIAVVDQVPGISQVDIATRVGRSQSTVSRRAAGLVEQGLLKAHRTGNETHLYRRDPFL